MYVALKYDVISQAEGDRPLFKSGLGSGVLVFNIPGCKVAGNGGNYKVEVGLNGSNLYPCFNERAVNCYTLLALALMQVVALLLFGGISPFL